MTRKRLLLYILCTWAVVGLLALVLQCATGGAAPLLGEPSAHPRLSYGLSMACAMSTILACFYLVRRQIKPLSQRLLLLFVPAVLTVLDYYFFFDSGMIACLPVLAAVSAMMLIKKES